MQVLQHSKTIMGPLERDRVCLSRTGISKSVLIRFKMPVGLEAGMDEQILLS
jgi:hypothetical protein